MNELNGRRGFTVVELGVLIAVVGSLGGVLVPAGNRIQKVNLDTKSQWVHHDLARRQMMYMGDNKGAFTGPNTTGAGWNQVWINIYPNPGIPTLEFDTASGNPTQLGDWITPLVGDSYGFSPNRAVRMQQSLEVMADPTTDRTTDYLYYQSSLDFQQFEDVVSQGGFRQQSFMQMRSFTHFSSERIERKFVIDGDKQISYYNLYAVQNDNDLALSPEGYTPSVYKVGVQLSNKVMFSDGTRYYEDEFGLSMAIDAQRLPVEGSDLGPLYNNSVAYGRLTHNSPSQTNLDLSYRKNGGQGLYVTMFDGSLKYMSREETWTDPTPWYPSGSQWLYRGARATPESREWVEKNLVDGVIH